MIKLKANAKINLALDILGKRNDGYHLVKMVMQSIDLYDIVTVSKEKTCKITIFSDFPFKEAAQDNIAYIAAKAFFDYTQMSNPGVSINIKKNIPLSAGLAGGSADGAAVILALNQIFGIGLSKFELIEIGENVGSDVPFCILGGTMLAKGIGTSLIRLKDMPDCVILLVKPGIDISTKEAYGKSDRIGESNFGKIKEMLLAINAQNLNGIASNLYNKFEDVINLTTIEKLKRLMMVNGAIGASMSGSGPAVYGIFNDAIKAQKCELELRKRYRDVYLCRPSRAVIE